MANSIRIAAWNSNGLKNHIHEVTLFLNYNKIDVLPISESHSTSHTVIRIPHYNLYFANHPDGTAHAGSAIIIRSAIDHYQLPSYTTNKIQSALVKVNLFPWPIIIGAVYCPPRHAITADEFQEFLLPLEPRFLVAGDWNAKHTTWGSRLISPKGRALFHTIQQHNLNCMSTGEPTYWPTDLRKIPDLLDFAVTKGISDIYSKTESNFDLHSDHSPIIITLSTNIIWKTTLPKLCTAKTDWEQFQLYINDNINLAHKMHTSIEIDETVEYLTNLIQEAAWQATPSDHKHAPEIHNIPLHIRQLVVEKRRARAKWQRSRNPRDKTTLNNLTHRLRNVIQENRNATFSYYISTLSPEDHTIWKATKKFKRPITQIPPLRKPAGNWARSKEEKANTFGDHLAQVFTPFPSNNPNFDTEIEEYLNSPGQLSLPLRPVSPAEVYREIKLTSSFKAPGYDLIVGNILKHLPKKAIVLITTIYNRMLAISHFPTQWKFALITMIAKPGKPPQETASYRPISLLPLLSKIFERLLLYRIKEITPPEELIPTHQFGFREGHSTIQQCHRIVNFIKETLEGKKMCASVFLDIQQAFDKVWHCGLLYKIKRKLPHQIFLLLKSYLTQRHFQVQFEGTLSNYHTISSGVPQGSVLGPFLYLLYTEDIPTTDSTLIATFADDTAIMSSDTNADYASEKLQSHLNLLQNWLDQWRIKVNSNKSTQITFTTKHSTCPQVTIYNQPIPIKTEVKYLGLHLDQRLTWKAHIKAKRQQLNLKTRSMHWLIGRKSQLTIKSKLLLYKVILTPIWSYGIELWGCSKPSNTKILQSFQSKTLRILADAPWYVNNLTLHNDLKIPFITEVISSYATKSRKRSLNHTNPLIADLYSHQPVLRRLNRQWPEDLFK